MTPPFVASDTLSDFANVRHGFFGRQGGVSTGPLASLNTSEAQGDDPTHVANNRAQILDALGFSPDALALNRQVHSTRVIALTDPAAIAERSEADAIVTNLRGVALGILTADCAPILLADPEAGIVGAAHAGWRGALNGVAETTVLAMVALGAEPPRIVAAIGPTISRPNYEVGAKFAEDAVKLEPRAATFLYEPNGFNATAPYRNPHFDLPDYLLHALGETGIGRIIRLPDCTYAEPDRWFSHRYATHHGTTTGRQLSVIGLV
jgi:YfiH family protein